MSDEGGIPADEAIAQVLRGMDRGQYLILVSALRMLGGKLRIDPVEFAAGARRPVPKLDVSSEDGFIVLRFRGE